jgi:hypothetical protein
MEAFGLNHCCGGGGGDVEGGYLQEILVKAERNYVQSQWRQNFTSPKQVADIALKNNHIRKQLSHYWNWFFHRMS